MVLFLQNLLNDGHQLCGESLVRTVVRMLVCAKKLAMVRVFVEVASKERHIVQTAHVHHTLDVAAQFGVAGLGAAEDVLGSNEVQQAEISGFEQFVVRRHATREVVATQ